MNNELLKKLVLNVLDAYSMELSIAGCNDLDSTHPLLRGITPMEFDKIQTEWRECFPEQANDFSRLAFDHFLMDLIEVKVKGALS